MSIVVMGTVALDSVKTPCGERDNQLGGSAAHFAMSARLFCPVHLCAVIGRDFPQKHLTFFKKLHINIDGLAVKEGCTFRWKGEYPAHDLNIANTLHTELGVIHNCVPQINPHHQTTKNVFLANYDPDVQQAFLDQFKRRPQFVGMDTMNLWINTKKKSLTRLIKQVDLLIVNDSEAKAFTDERNLLKAAKAISRLGPHMVIIKKGEHGVLFYSQNFVFALPAYPLEEVLDPTGAGDTFAGGVMGYLAKASKINSQTLLKALSYATILSSFNVQGFGMSKTSKLTLAKVNERLNGYKKFFKF